MYVCWTEIVVYSITLHYHFFRLKKKWLQTKTGWKYEKLNRFIRVLPRLTGIFWIQSGKSRSIREMGTLLVVKNPHCSQETQKVSSDPCRLAIRRTQQIFLYVTQTYWNVMTCSGTWEKSTIWFFSQPIKWLFLYRP